MTYRRCTSGDNIQAKHVLCGTYCYILRCARDFSLFFVVTCGQEISEGGSRSWNELRQISSEERKEAVNTPIKGARGSICNGMVLSPNTFYLLIPINQR
jgi:hypothetical protein